jgi:hypothetical protein
MAKNRDRWAFWFVVGFVGAIVFWGWVASTIGPHAVHQQVPLSSVPGYIRENVCGWGNHPVAPIIRINGGSGSNLYNVTCSNGDVVETSW